MRRIYLRLLIRLIYLVFSPPRLTQSSFNTERSCSTRRDVMTCTADTSSTVDGKSSEMVQ